MSETTKKLSLQWERLEIHNETVYRRYTSRHSGEPDYVQLMVPRSDVSEVLRLCHAGEVGGHFGIKKTMDQVQRKYYWPTWKSDTTRFVRQCSQCNTYHRGKLKRQGELRPVLAGSPYERWYIDLTGPHPKSDRGNIWILTCMDSFTKWAEAFPIRNKEAETIAKVLVEQLFVRFGPPASLLSDQGKEVDGRIMREVCRMFGIEKLRTTPYKPSTNQVERFHRSLNSVLAKTVAEHQRNWDVRLPYAVSAYRATRHDATGYSPNFLVLGREVWHPAEVVYGKVEESLDETYGNFVENVRERMSTAFDEARKTLRRSAERNKRYYNLSVKPNRFAVGQWVWYFNSRKYRARQMKRTRQYEGPFLVTKLPSDLTAEIRITAKSTARVVHIDKLKEFVGPTPKSWIGGESPARDQMTTPKRFGPDEAMASDRRNDDIDETKVSPSNDINEAVGFVNAEFGVKSSPPNGEAISSSKDEAFSSPKRRSRRRIVRPARYRDDASANERAAQSNRNW